MPGGAFRALTMLLFVLLFAAAVRAEERTAPQPQRTTAVGEWRPEEAGEQALSINEPIYFVVGRAGGETLGRFQFSFKYRLFDADGWVVGNAPWLERLHLGYTQTSLWNLSADSKPFEDSSYRPSFFWEFERPRRGILPDFLRLGYEHESNGQGEERSRSIDTLFLLPAWETTLAGRTLLAGAKLFAYLDQDRENGDIEEYRGYVDLTLRYGNEDGWLTSLLWRHGSENRNTLQLDLSYPLRQRFFARTGGYFYLQAFHGYGQSLLTYDRQEDLNVGIGFAIVR